MASSYFISHRSVRTENIKSRLLFVRNTIYDFRLLLASEFRFDASPEDHGHRVSDPCAEFHRKFSKSKIIAVRIGDRDPVNEFFAHKNRIRYNRRCEPHCGKLRIYGREGYDVKLKSKKNNCDEKCKSRSLISRNINVVKLNYYGTVELIANITV